MAGARPGGFNSETLEVTLRGKTIDDVLNMSVEEGETFFAGEPSWWSRAESGCARLQAICKTAPGTHHHDEQVRFVGVLSTHLDITAWLPRALEESLPSPEDCAAHGSRRRPRAGFRQAHTR